jgi:hypothetical protein
VLPAEHLLDFAGLDFLFEAFESRRKLPVHVLAGFSPLEQHRQIVAAAPERRGQIAILLQAAAALENTLSFGLIFPEVRRGGSRFEAGQFVVGAGCFKDNSADRPLAC